MMRRGSSVAGAARLGVWLLALAAGCGGGVKEELLPPDPNPGPRRDSGVAGAAGDAAGPADGADAATPDTTAGMGGDGMPTGGNGSGGAVATGGSGGGDATPTGCMPNPDALDEVCPLVCPEVCNDEDDDCDRRIDEGAADLECAADHTSSICSRGECVVVECLDAYRDCDGDPANGCEVAPEDPSHCGVCGRVCALENASAACVDGACRVAVCAEDWGDCDGDLTSCETQVTSLEHCGACSSPCPELDNADATCARGFCEPDKCRGNFGDCDLDPATGCELPLDSLDNCGGCGVVCDLGGGEDDCSTGVCVAVGCDVGYADCDQSATTACDSLNTLERCGACASPCTVEALDHVTATSCESMTCVATCEAGFGDCDAEPGCETQLRSLSHCGDCGVPCALDNAVATCASGSCEFVRCEDGYGDCNDDTTDGCEQALDTLTHCGGCGVACNLVSCAGGTCSSEACTPPMADCDLANNDCEVDLSSSLDHCGGCNNACTFTVPAQDQHGSLECDASQCSVACDAGWGDCDDDHENGCETPLNTLTDCGQCGMGCSAVNATATCATGQCRVDTCDPDWKDCDGNGTSCEREIDTVSDCGDCGAACSLENAFAVCGGTAGSRSCQIDQCTDVAFRSCDTNDLTGCEVDTRDDTGNCGSCGNDCLGQPHVTAASCVDSACQPSGCETGWGNCTSGAGCETPLDTVQNCGMCGNDCGQLVNTQATSCNAANLACQIDTCDPGFDSCDSQVSTGCETSILTPNDCGGCASSGQNEPCANLAHVTQSSCGSGSCQIDACQSGWDDCDADVGNGCERNLMMEGPCYPDTGCTRQTFGDAIYFFCTNNYDWATARALCLTLVRGDLVSVESSAENDFLASHYTADAWIGARDPDIEGLWRWERNGVPFWQGLDNGTALLGNFENWSQPPQPDDWMGAEDCAELWSGGVWNDSNCGNTRDFICEVIPDRCPSDSSKTDPGQCGCGNPDTDADMDGFAVCNDGCDDDPAKLAPGACGCGMPDLDDDSDGYFNCEEVCTTDPDKQDPGTCGCGNPDVDSDGDGPLDCLDPCPNDGTKQDPGQCGCGNPDTDSDGDGAADCVDGCPLDPATTSAQDCGFPYTPDNFDPTVIDPNQADPTTTIDCAAVLNTTSLAFTTWCGGSAPQITAQTQTVGGGPQVAVVAMQNLTVTSGGSLSIVGSLPAVLAVFGDATINGPISASASGSTPGGGGNWSCGASQGGNGSGTSSLDGSGGGGGGFGTQGGNGGTSGTYSGGSGGNTRGNASLTPLVGGCRGGNGGGQNCQGAAGGGAFQISVGGTLTLTSTLSANGAGAPNCGQNDGGGGGGGSGGGIKLQASMLTDGSTKQTNGGRGGNGQGGGSGGGGSTSAGSNGSNGGNGGGNGGGGGGGGYGRIAISTP